MGDHGDIGEPKGELWDNVLSHGGHAKDDLWPPDSESDARALGTEWGKAAGALRNAIEVSNGVANGVRSAWPDPNGYAMYDNIVSVNNGDARGKGGIKEIPPAMDGLGEAYKGYGEIVEFVKTQINETISYNNFIYSHLDDGGAYLNPLGGYAQEIFAKAVAKNIADLVKTAASRISNPHSGSTRRPEIPNPGLVGGVLDTIGSLVRGMGELIGYGEDDFGGASWSWSNAVLAWGGMAKLGAAVQAYTHGLGYVDLTTGLPGGKRGELGSTLVDFGKNFVRWNEWSKDPAHAAGGLGVNVASVVGLRGVGAGIRVAGTGLSRVGSATVKAADLSRVGDLTAARLGNAVGRFGDGMSRFGNDLTKVPTVTELAIKNTPRAIDAVRNFGKVDHEIPHITAHTAARVLENPLGPLPGTVGDNLGKNANLTPHPPATPPHDPGVVRGPGNSPHDPNTRGGDNGGQQFPPSTRQLDPPTQRPVVEPAHPSGPAEPLRPLEQRPPSGPEGGPPHPPAHPVPPGDTGLTPGQGATHSAPAAGGAERAGAAGHPVNEGSPVKAGQPPASPFGTVGLHELARGELGQAGIAGVAEARASGRWKGEPGPDAPPGAPREPGKQGPQGPPGQGGPERPVKPQGKEENGQPPAQPLAPKGGDNGRLDSQTSLGAKEHERASGDSEHRGDRVGEEGPPAREEQPSKSPSDVLELADLARGELGEAGHGGIAEARASGQWGDPEPGPRRPGDSPDSPDEGPVNPDETTRGGRPRSPDPVLPDQGAATPHEADKGGGVATAVRPEPQDPMPASHGAPSRAPAVTEQQPAARPARSSSSGPSPQPVHGAALAERAKVADVIAGAAKPELRPEAQPLTVWPHPAEIPADDPGRLYRVTDPVRPAIGFPPQPTIGSPVPPAVGFPSQPGVGFPRPPAEVPSSPDRTAIPVRPTAPSQPAHPEPPNPGPGPEWPLELPAWPDHAADPVAPLTPGGPERPGPEMVPPPPEPAFTTHPVKPVPIELPLRPDQAFPPGPAKNPPWPGAPATSPIPYVPTHPEPVVPEWPVELPPRQDQATGTGPSEFPTPPAGLPPEVWDALTEAEREALVALSALSGVNAARILERIVTEAAAANGIGKNASLSERLASLTNAQRPAIGERLTEILGRRPVRQRPATEDKPEPEFHIQGSPEVLFFPYTISLNSDMIAAYRTYDKAVQEFHELQEQFLWAAQFLPREEFEELLRAGEDWAQLKERLRNLRDNVLAALAAAWELGARNPEELAAQGLPEPRVAGVREPVYDDKGGLLGYVDLKTHLEDGSELWVTVRHVPGTGEKALGELIKEAEKAIAVPSNGAKRYFVISGELAPKHAAKLAEHLMALGFDAVLHRGTSAATPQDRAPFAVLATHPPAQAVVAPATADPVKPRDLPAELEPLWETLSTPERRVLADLAAAVGPQTGLYALMNFATWLAREKGLSSEVVAALAGWLAQVAPPAELPDKWVPVWQALPSAVQQVWARLSSDIGMGKSIGKVNTRLSDLAPGRDSELDKVNRLNHEQLDVLRRQLTELVDPTEVSEMGRALFFHSDRPISDRWLILHKLIDRLREHGVSNADQLAEDLRAELTLTFEKSTGLDPANKIDTSKVGGDSTHFTGLEAALICAVRLADLVVANPRRMAELGLPGLRILAVDRKIYNGKKVASDIDIVGELADGSRVWIEVKASRIDPQSKRFQEKLVDKVPKQRGHPEFTAFPTQLFAMFAEKITPAYAAEVLRHDIDAVLYLDEVWQNVELAARRAPGGSPAPAPPGWSTGGPDPFWPEGALDPLYPPPGSPMSPHKRLQPPRRQAPHPRRPAVPTRPEYVPVEVWNALTEAERSGVANIAAVASLNALAMLAGFATEVANKKKLPRLKKLPTLLASFTAEQHHEVARLLGRAISEGAAGPRPLEPVRVTGPAPKPLPSTVDSVPIEVGTPVTGMSRRSEVEQALGSAFPQALRDAGLTPIAQYVRSSVVARSDGSEFTVVVKVSAALRDDVAQWSVPERGVLRITVSDRMAPDSAPMVLAHALAAGAANLTGNRPADPDARYLSPDGNLDGRPELTPTDRGHLAQLVVLDRELGRATGNLPRRLRLRKAMRELLVRLGLDPNQAGSGYRREALARESVRWVVLRHLPPKETDGYLLTRTHLVTNLMTSFVPTGLSAAVFAAMGSPITGLGWALTGLLNAVIGAFLARKWEIGKDEQVAKARQYDATARKIDAAAPSARWLRAQLDHLGWAPEHGSDEPVDEHRMGPRPDVAQTMREHVRRFSRPPVIAAATAIGATIPFNLSAASVFSLAALAAVVAVFQPLAERARTRIQKVEELARIDEHARALDEVLAESDEGFYLELGRRLGLEQDMGSSRRSGAHLTQPKPPIATTELSQAANLPDAVPYLSEIMRRALPKTASGTIDQAAFLAQHLSLFQTLLAYGAGKSLVTVLIAVWQLNELDENELVHTVARRSFDEGQFRGLMAPELLKQRKAMLESVEAAVAKANRPNLLRRLGNSLLLREPSKQEQKQEPEQVASSSEPATEPRPGFAPRAEFMKVYTRIPVVVAASGVMGVELLGVSPSLGIAALTAAFVGPLVGWRKWRHRQLELEIGDKAIAETNLAKAVKRTAEQVEAERHASSQVIMSAQAVTAEVERANRPVALDVASKAFDVVRQAAEFAIAGATKKPAVVEPPTVPLLELRPPEIKVHKWLNEDWASDYQADLQEARRSIEAEKVRLRTDRSWGDYATLGERLLTDLGALADRAAMLLDDYHQTGNGDLVWVANAELHNAIENYQRLSSADWPEAIQEPAPDWPDSPGKHPEIVRMSAPEVRDTIRRAPPVLNTPNWADGTGWGTVPRGADGWLPGRRRRGETPAGVQGHQPPAPEDFSSLARSTPLNSLPAIHAHAVRTDDEERLVAAAFPELPKTNPNAYSPDALREGFRTNCTRAVVAYVRRLRGEDVTAGPVRPEDAEQLASREYVSDRLGGLWDFSHGASYDSVIAAMHDRPIGAMAVVDVVYIGRDLVNQEHVALVVRGTYGVAFVDPQTGWLLKLPERPISIAVLPFTDVDHPAPAGRQPASGTPRQGVSLRRDTGTAELRPDPRYGTERNGIRYFETNEQGEIFGETFLAQAFRDLPTDAHREAVKEFSNWSYPFVNVKRQGDAERLLREWWDYNHLLNLFGGREPTLEQVFAEEGRPDLTKAQRKSIDYIVHAQNPVEMLRISLESRPYRDVIRGQFQGGYPTPEMILDRIRLLDEAFDTPLAEGVQVVRGLRDVSFMEGFREDDPRSLQGTVQRDPGYLSCSLGREPAYNGPAYPYRLHLDVPKGAPGLWLGRAGWNAAQRQFVLPAGVAYRIIGVRKDTIEDRGTGEIREVWNLYGKVIPPGLFAESSNGAPEFRTLTEPRQDPESEESPALYGPFYRLESPSQSAEVARMQAASKEIWGRAPVYGDGEPAVQAYRGPLPQGRRGVEFWTDIKPLWHNTKVAMRAWYPKQGVRVEDDFAKLDVVVTKNTQTIGQEE